MPADHAITCLADVRDARGFALTPLAPRTKVPVLRNWQKAHKPTSLEWLDFLRSHYPNYNVGVLTRGLFVYDNDEMDRRLAARLLDACAQILGGRPPHGIGARPGGRLVYRAWKPTRKVHLGSVDFLGDKGVIAAYGTHPSGILYSWPEVDLFDNHQNELPVATPEGIEYLKLETLRIQGTTTRVSLTAPAVQRPDRDLAEKPGKASLLIDDCRDEAFARMEFECWLSGLDDPVEIAKQVWARAPKEINLSRPKRGGTQPWTFDDVLQKAHYLVKSGKQRALPIQSAIRFDGGTEGRQAFLNAVNAIAAAGRLPDGRRLSPAGVAVSNVMLSLVLGPQGCFASPATIAQRLNYTDRTVKRERQRLSGLGLWEVKTLGGGRGHSAHYFPNYAAAAELAQKVTNFGTRVTREEEEEEPRFISLQEQIQNNHTQGFEFLRGNLRDGEDA